MDYQMENRTPRDRASCDCSQRVLNTDENNTSCSRGYGRQQTYPTARTTDRMPCASRNGYTRGASCDAIRNGNQRYGNCPASRLGNGCGQPPEEWMGPLVMVYTISQPWDKIYTPEEALERGTLFPSLDFPFLASSCKETRGGCGR